MVLHLCAENDVNGNPRRLFATVHETGSYFDKVWDEGYEGKPEELRGQDALKINITTKEYKSILQSAEALGRRAR